MVRTAKTSTTRPRINLRTLNDFKNFGGVVLFLELFLLRFVAFLEVGTFFFVITIVSPTLRNLKFSIYSIYYGNRSKKATQNFQKTNSNLLVKENIYAT